MQSDPILFSTGTYAFAGESGDFSSIIVRRNQKFQVRRFHVAIAAVHPNDHELGQSIVSVFCVVNDSHVINSSFLCSAVRYIVINAGMKKRHTIVYRPSGEMAGPAGQK